jgi:hypothetical protein
MFWNFKKKKQVITIEINQQNEQNEDKWIHERGIPIDLHLREKEVKEKKKIVINLYIKE